MLTFEVEINNNHICTSICETVNKKETIPNE